MRGLIRHSRQLQNPRLAPTTRFDGGHSRKGHIPQMTGESAHTAGMALRECNWDVDAGLQDVRTVRSSRVAGPRHAPGHFGRRPAPPELKPYPARPLSPLDAKRIHRIRRRSFRTGTPFGMFVAPSRHGPSGTRQISRRPVAVRRDLFRCLGNESPMPGGGLRSNPFDNQMLVATGWIVRSPEMARTSSAAEPRHRPAPACFRGKQGKGLCMAVQTLRHAAALSLTGHRLPDRMLALLNNAALKERIPTPRGSGNRVSPYDRFPSLTAIQMYGPDWRPVSVLVAPSAPVPPHRAMKAFFSWVRIALAPLRIPSVNGRGGAWPGLERAFAGRSWRESIDILKHCGANVGIPFIELPGAGMSLDCPLRDPVRQSADGSCPLVRGVGPLVGPRRGRGKERAGRRRACCRRRRAGGWDDAQRSRGILSTLNRGSQERLSAHSHGADGGSGSRTASVERGIPVLHFQVPKGKGRFGKAGNGEGELLPARI